MMTAQKVNLENVTASITLPLPPGAELKVDKNQKVEEGQIVAFRKACYQIKNYHLAKLLDVPPKQTINFLTKKLGEEVKEGDLIAQKKSFLGKSEKFIAPISGVLDSINEEGVLRIKKEIAEEEIKAPFAGIVTDSSSNSLSLTFAAIEIKGNWGRGKKVTGCLSFIEGEELDLFSLDGAYEKQLIAIKGNLSKGLWYKAISLGATGVIAGDVKEEFLIKEIEKEDSLLPVVLLEKDDKIEKEIWEELKKANGRMILIDGEQKQILIPKQKQ